MTATSSDVAVSMDSPRLGVVRSELAKLWALRSPRGLALAIVVASIGLAISRAAIAPAPDADAALDHVALESLAIGALPISFLSALVGLVAMGSEYSGDVLSGTLIAVPRRRRVVVAKLIAAATVSASAGAVGLAAAGVTSGVILWARGYPPVPSVQMLGVGLCCVVSCGAFAALGVANAVLSRSVVGAAMLLAAVTAVLPSALGVILRSAAGTVTDLLPASGVQAAVTRDSMAVFTLEGVMPSSLPWWGGILVVLGWAAASSVAALAMIGRRRARPEAAPAPRTRARRREGASVERPAVWRVLGSEWLKLRTLPAAWWLIGASSASIIGFSLVAAFGSGSNDMASATLPNDIAYVEAALQAGAITAGIGIAQILIAIFGAVVITSEYSTGTIQPAFVAVPRRARLLAAKVALVAGSALVATVASLTLAAVLSTLVLRSQGFALVFWSATSIESVARCALAMTLVSVIGCALGTILRSPIAAVATVIGVFVVSRSILAPLQILSRDTPWVWLANLEEFFPFAPLAVQIVPPNAFWPLMLDGGVLQLTPDLSMLVIAAWTAIAVVLATVLIKRRSA